MNKLFVALHWRPRTTRRRHRPHDKYGDGWSFPACLWIFNSFGRTIPCQLFESTQYTHRTVLEYKAFYSAKLIVFQLQFNINSTSISGNNTLINKSAAYRLDNMQITFTSQLESLPVLRASAGRHWQWHTEYRYIPVRCNCQNSIKVSIYYPYTHWTPLIFSRGSKSLCSDSMQSFFTTAFHQVRTSGHQWNSFYFFFVAFNPLDPLLGKTCATTQKT